MLLMEFNDKIGFRGKANIQLPPIQSVFHSKLSILCNMLKRLANLIGNRLWLPRKIVVIFSFPCVNSGIFQKFSSRFKRD